MSVPLAYTLVLFTVAGTSVCTWQALNAWRDRRTERRAQALADARQRTGLADSTPGTDTALQDACELLWDLDAYDPAAAIDEGLTRLFEQLGPPPADDPELDTGCARLRDAITEHRQQEGGTD